MRILVIKQTSLGDVLHSTGHVRTIKENFPDSHLVLLTAESSMDIYRHNPWVDEFIPFDRDRLKHEWLRHPWSTMGHVGEVLARVRQQPFDLAFDLQGLARSVVFLYGARARRKYVKGRWWGLPGYRNREDHAIAEMDGVLKVAGLTVRDSSMAFHTSEEERLKVDDLLEELEAGSRPLAILSPFSRWQSKDWPLTNYLQLAAEIPSDYFVLVTGAKERRQEVEAALQAAPVPGVVNLLGRLSLAQFAELTGRAAFMLTGDSFPMHVACARGTPVVALFGPTDESRVGPRGGGHQVVRAPGCNRCDRPACPQMCLRRLTVAEVAARIPPP